MDHECVSSAEADWLNRWDEIEQRLEAAEAVCRAVPGTKTYNEAFARWKKLKWPNPTGVQGES